jgi:hypothetical protein
MGGIFQFPLERTSPRIKRGITGSVGIPYITPSLVDHPSHPPDVDPNSPQQADFWRPKWLPPFVGDLGPAPAFVYAPWRSLIYRNVDTPFAYSDDFALYPHMPMNSPGYDVRAKRILGDWMVSIPGVRKRQDIPEYHQPFPDAPSDPDAAPFVPDDNEQPYVEVHPGEPGYDGAVAAAELRLQTFHAGTQPFEVIPNNSGGFYEYRGRYAATLDSSDTVDPEVDGVCSLIPIEKEIPTINVPTHPHWVPLDLTQKPGAWEPRRGDWKAVLVDQQIPPPVNACAGDPNLVQAKFEDMKRVVALIRQRTLDETVNVDGKDQKFRDFALTKVPMGLWQDKAECTWSNTSVVHDNPTLDQVPASQRLPWMDAAGPDAGSRHVYSQVPGAAIFNMICINCHGAKFDSVGRLAENLATMTGGKARVADLRDGLFGPVGDPQNQAGSNRASVFGDVAKADGVTADDWGARYVGFMALGGTGATIPAAFLTNVSRTLVFGESRAALVPPKSANMLSIARELCLSTLSTPAYHFGLPADAQVGYFDSVNVSTPTKQLWHSGDAEMWLKLCSINNPPPVQPYMMTSNTLLEVLPIVSNALDDKGFPPKEASLVTGLTPPALLKRCAYEAGQCGPDKSRVPHATVGDERGRVSDTLDATNLHPWCVLGTTFDPTKADVAGFFKNVCMGGPNCVGGKCNGDPSGCQPPPMCPVQPALTDLDAWDDAVGSAADEWATRGAINAGFAVFLYLDSVAKNGGVASPTFDHCEQLPQ